MRAATQTLPTSLSTVSPALRVVASDRKPNKPRSNDRATSTSPAAPDSYQALLLDNLSFIERTVNSIARRHAVKPWDRDDFEGMVKLRLVSDDYAILRKFQGRSKLTTFLTSVIHNLFRDFRIQRWGKWRPSAAAKRMGDVGVQLESLLYRDSFGFQEACEILRDRVEVTVSDAELATLAGELPFRTGRRFESDAELEGLEASERGDQAVLDGERAKTLARVREALCQALSELEVEDRLILKMRFADSLTIRAIAETLELEPRSMYSRLQSLLGVVRKSLVGQGLTCEEVLDLLAWPACDLEPL